MLNHRAHRDGREYGMNSGPHPTLCFRWPLWLVLSRFLEESELQPGQLDLHTMLDRPVRQSRVYQCQCWQLKPATDVTA